MMYTHLSLLEPDHQPAISIRYDLFVADVYESFGRSWVAPAPSLSILFDVENLVLEERREDPPSWVPNIRRTNFANYLALTHRRVPHKMYLP
jgi:hypothetical protein